MGSMRTNYPPAFKAKVALEAYKEERTSAGLASQYQVHPGLIRNWKSTLVREAPDMNKLPRRKQRGIRNALADGLREAYDILSLAA